MSNDKNGSSKSTDGDDIANSKDVENETNEEAEKCEKETENIRQIDEKEICEIKVGKDINETVLNINVDENVRNNKRRTWMMFIFGYGRQDQNLQPNQPPNPLQNPQPYPPQNLPQYPGQYPGQYPQQNPGQYPPQYPGHYFQQNPGQYPPQYPGQYPQQNPGQYLQQYPQPNRIYGFGNFYSNMPPEERPPLLAYKPDTRNGFVRLVMTIVLIMLIITAGFVTLVRVNEDLNYFFRHVSILLVFLIAFILLMTAEYAFMCSPCARVMPCNFVMLFLTLVAMSLMSAKLTVHFKTDVIIYAVLATTGIVIICVGLACTKFDFTKFMLYIVVIGAAFSLVVMIILLVKMISGVWMKPVIMGILAIGTLLQAVLLVLELQMVLGGRSVELSEHDYAIGAFMIYSSIIDIFLKMGLLMDMGS